MKTPYDTALRLLRLEVDQLAVAIGDVGACLGAIELRRRELSASIDREARLATAAATLPAHGYFDRMRGVGAGLAGEERFAEQRLDALRLEAKDRYGRLHAIEQAADGFRADADRAIDLAEQAQVDDFTGARFARTIGIARRQVRRG